MKKWFILLGMAWLATGCSQPNTYQKIDIQGHRGARGLYPENSIYGFVKTLDFPVNTLEMDLAITKDNQVIVSHEPYLSADICLRTTGQSIKDDWQDAYNVYLLTYEELQRFDCGTKPHPRFPDQEKVQTSKPLLKDVIDTVETIIGDRKIAYNLEIKSQDQTDGVYHPAPDAFVDLVVKVIEGKLPWERVIFQSFDFRVLQYLNEKYPMVQTAILIENELSWRQNLDSLGFKPTIYSPDYKLLSKAIINELHDEEIKVIPWTVNNRNDMDRLLKWGIDGIITDYPNRVYE